jgi:hypothetical protein
LRERPRIYADFNNADLDGRLRLSVAGAAADLENFHPPLKSGAEITVYDEEHEADAVLEFSAREGIWVARIEWLPPGSLA